MIERFLKAKHWQLFLLTYGIPIIIQFVLMGSMFSGISTGKEPDPEMMFTYFKIVPMIILLFMSVFFGWFWSIVIGLDKKIPQKLKLNTTRFKVFLAIPIIYFLLIAGFMGMVMNGMIGNDMEPSIAIFAIIFPLHLFAMFCIFYCLYFVAKTIKTAETQRHVKFGDFAGEFFLIWFYPIGIWFVQPKINLLSSE